MLGWATAGVVATVLPDELLPDELLDESLDEPLDELVETIQLWLFSQPHPSPSESLSADKQTGFACTGDAGKASVNAMASSGSESEGTVFNLLFPS